MRTSWDWEPAVLLNPLSWLGRLGVWAVAAGLLVVAFAAGSFVAPSQADGECAPYEPVSSYTLYDVRDFTLRPRVSDYFIEDTYMTRQNEGWLAGQCGTIIHYKDGRFTDLRDPNRTKGTIHELRFLNPDDGYGAGGPHQEFTGSGTIVHYKNGQWTREETGVGNWIQSVVPIDEDEAWAVGTGGVILHRKNGAWSRFPSPTTKALKWVDFSSPTNGWIIGTEVLLRFENCQWVEKPLPLERRTELYSLKLLGDDDGWIVGQYGTILRYRNGSWQPYPSNTELLLEKVKFINRNEGYACGWHEVVGKRDAGVVWYKDGLWTPFPPLANHKIFGCSFHDARHGLVGGHHGLIWTYDVPNRVFVPAVAR